MLPPNEDSPSSQPRDDSGTDQIIANFDEMAENSHEDNGSSLDSMATASASRPSAIPDPSAVPTSHPRPSFSPFLQYARRQRGASDDTASTMSGAVTPRCSQIADAHLLSGAGGPSGPGLEDIDNVHFDADIESMLHGKRIEPLVSCDYNRGFHPSHNGRLSDLFSATQAKMQAHLIEQFHLDRRSSNSSTFTNETPGLTSAGSSRANTFAEPLPIFDEAGINFSESPATTPGFGQKILDLKDWIADMRSQDRRRPSRALTKEPQQFPKSPLRSSMELKKRDDPPRYDGYRSPKPPVSESGDSESNTSSLRFDRLVLPGETTADDELYVSDSECSEVCDEIDESHPLFDIKPAVVRDALLEYRQWKTAATNGNNAAPSASQSAAPTTSNAGSSRRSSGKRQREQEGVGNDGDDGDGGDEPPQKRPARSPESGSNTLTPIWACPFAKNDPAKHKACYAHLLTRIKDVKQHLRRKHGAPVYCPRCRGVFDDEDQLETHSRQREGCERSEAPLPEGMTPAQKEKLDRRVKSKTWFDQWYEIFNIFFENCPQPKSPYIEQELAEELRGFMDMMSEKGRDIIMGHISRSDLIQRLEGMGLQVNEHEEHTITSLISASVTSGLHAINETWKSSASTSCALPSLTEGETVQSSAQQSGEDGIRNMERTFPSDGSDPTSMATEDPFFGNDAFDSGDPTLRDSVVYFPDGSSMHTPNLNGGEWTPVDPDLQFIDHKPNTDGGWSVLMGSVNPDQLHANNPSSGI